MHEFSDGTLHPIHFFSKSFNAAQKNYSQIDKEATALCYAIKCGHKWLYGRRFELQTDHKPLLSIFGSKQGIPVYTASRLQRYALFLLNYDFSIVYVNTDKFGYADVISRLIEEYPKTDDEMVIALIQVEQQQCFAIETAKSLPVQFENIREATRQCAVLQKVIAYTETSWPATRRVIQNAEVEKFFDMRSTFIIIDECLFSGDRIIIPTVFRRRILEELHTGHPGYVRMKLRAQGSVFWPSINKDIERAVQCCEDCAKVPRSPIKCTLKSWPVPTKPWSRIHADFAGPVDGAFYLVIVDAFSNWPEVFKLSSITSAKTIECFEEVIARHGFSMYWSPIMAHN